jgi:replicative DNA helicase
MTALRVPPHSIEAEQSVLGGLMLAASAWDRVCGILREEDFYRADHRAIWRAVARLADHGRPVDVLTVWEAIKAEGKFPDALRYLHEIVQATPSAANIHRYAEIVRDKALLRRLGAIAHDILESVETPGEAAEKVDGAQAAMMELTQHERRGEPRGIEAIVTDALVRIDDAMKRGGKPSGLMTDLADLDRHLGGLDGGNLVLIAGRPGMGKTTLALQIAENVAEQGKGVGIFSMEMGEQELAIKQVAAISGVHATNIRHGKLSHEEFERVARAAHNLASRRISVDESGGLTISQVRSRARIMRRKFGLDLIVVDYLQMMTGQGDNRVQVLEAISRGLKSLAKELAIPVIALSQLNRGVEQRPNKRPVLSDLRDSGSLEQDADIVIGLYRDDYYNADSPDRGTAEALILKHRMGETGMVRLAFMPQTSRFGDFAGFVAPPPGPSHPPRRDPVFEFRDQ